MVGMMKSFLAALGCCALVGCAGAGLGTGTPLVTSDVDALAVGPGAALPFGEIATTCGIATADMGMPVAAASGYTVYDTAPTSTAVRTHYIDGFSDGCARQFTAALVLTGDVSTHEGVRYARTPAQQRYSETDTAYEAIKRAFCGVGTGEPCGSRIDALSRRTVFVTAYPQFSGSNSWKEFLLHEGTVAASGTETP